MMIDAELTAEVRADIDRLFEMCPISTEHNAHGDDVWEIRVVFPGGRELVCRTKAAHRYINEHIDRWAVSGLWTTAGNA